MRNEETYTETFVWSDLVGVNCSESGDWDDCYDREAHDWRRAQRDGWGSQMVWDGR